MLKISMADAGRDSNRAVTLLGISNTDFTTRTPVTIGADPVTHELLVQASVSIAANSSVNVNQWGGTATTLGQKAMTASVPVVLASDQSAITPTKSSTGTVTQVGDSASSVTLKAANASRLGLTVFNNSSAVLYLKAGATASTSSYTVELQQGDYWEAPANYTGIVDGIWSADSGGSALITEYTA